MTNARSSLAPFRPALLALTVIAGSGQAGASWLDSDFYCRVYGCVVVHDGYTFDVYDVYNFNTGGTVAPGQPLRAWSGNPFDGAGEVNPVFTGTRTEGFIAAPVRDEGVMLGIDRNGNGRIDIDISDDGDGVLDAADRLDPFEIDRRTGITAVETSAQRSFYIASRTDFYIAARVQLTGPQGGLATLSSLDRIALAYSITGSGNDAGMRFGADADRGGWRDLRGAETLGDLAGAPVFLGEFTRDIRRRNADTVAEQSVRFDYVYGFENYDLSMGAGTLAYRIEFSFYNR